MPVFLNGLGLTRYRGIGPKTQYMAPFAEFNFFIGANNAGKSIVLNFISKHLPSVDGMGFSKPNPPAVDPLEIYSGGVQGGVFAGIGIPKSQFISSIIERQANNPHANAAVDVTEKLANHLAHGDFVWLQTAIPPTGELTFLADTTTSKIKEALTPNEWQHLWHVLTGQGRGGLEQHWVPETLKHIRTKQKITFPEVVIIPAIRQIGPRGEAFADYSGKGLIDRLAEIQSPDHDKREDRKLFDAINRFLRTVTSHPDAQIEIPHNREHILVHINNRVLPLHSLGTGIHEVILIAASCTLSRQKIVCIEEPEIHLHPLLQRKLISFLKAETSNQYFIATHSASFIDTPGAAIFHVTNDATQTYIRESILKDERYEICMELGHRASDIVQSNAVIWVEGPSDRTYIKAWIEHVDPELIEGTHYSIMFYGGRLLSHLSADDSEITDFISLKGLNRNLAIVMDSDKKSEDEEINDTKKRIADEIGKGRGVAWVTKGREIENYIDHVELQGAVESINTKSYIKPASGGQYDHALHFRRHPKKKRDGTVPSGTELEDNVDKVKVARIVTDLGVDLSVLDLRDRVNDLVEMIRRANS
jgi:hypothetical protein